MKIVGFTALHYGSEYLAKAIQSIDHVVDEHVIVYSERPSYAHQTVLSNPDSEQKLKDIAFSVSSKIIWDSHRSFHHEGHHRNRVFNFAKDGDLVIVVDSDELWEEPENAIQESLKHRARQFPINGFVNFWKSTKYIMRDGFQPIRIIRPGMPNVQHTINATIYHMGYCIDDATMLYKLDIHGHKADIINVHGSAQAYFNKFKSWTHPGCGVTHLHPASKDIWIDAEEYNGKLHKLLQ